MSIVIRRDSQEQDPGYRVDRPRRKGLIYMTLGTVAAMTAVLVPFGQKRLSSVSSERQAGPAVVAAEPFTGVEPIEEADRIGVVDISPPETAPVIISVETDTEFFEESDEVVAVVTTLPDVAPQYDDVAAPTTDLVIDQPAEVDPVDGPADRENDEALPVEASPEILPDPEVQMPKSFKMTVLGDSIVNGFLLKEGENARWTNLLQEMFKSDPVLAGVEVDNKAIPGQSINSARPKGEYTDEMTGEKIDIGGTLLEQVLEMYPEGEPVPDMVVIIPSINEIIVSPGTSPEERARTALDWLILVKQYLADRGVKYILVTPMFQVGDAWDESVDMPVNLNVSTFNEEGFRSGVINMPVDYLKYMDKNGDGGIDEEFYDEWAWKVGPDRLHPDRQGHEAMALAYAEPLAPLLRELLN